MTRAVRCLLAGLFLGFLMVGATAGPALAADPFVIGPGDKIAINVHQRPDLSGEFRVLPGGALSMPFIGSMPVAGLSIEELREKLVQRLRDDAALLDPRVSVQIAELQPILVAGIVRRPGQYAFQLGMTVGHAVAIAGGMRRIDAEEIGGRIEIARLREVLRQSQDGLGVALIGRARLAAEARGAEDFEVPADATRYLAPDRLHQSYEAEREIMRRRTAAYTSQLAMLTAQTAAFHDEIQALQEQNVSKDQEAALLNQERAYITDLLRQGLTARDSRIVQLARSAVQVEGERRQIMAFIARARQEIARIDQARTNANTQRQLEIASGLKDTDDTLARLRVAVEETRASLTDLREALPAEDVPLGPPSSVTYTILRVRSSPQQRIEARADTPLLPGDLVEVNSGDTGPGRRLAAGAPR